MADRAGSEAIGSLEAAVQLLRRTALSTLLCHWIGSAPFALALLLFWSDVTQYRPSSAACAEDALLLAALLPWMNCWRAVFAGRLRGQLSGQAPQRVRFWRMLTMQSFLGALKLVGMPLAMLCIFPAAATAAFFRYSLALAGREGDGDALQVISRAAKLARMEQRRTWLTMALIAVLGIAAFCNVALALMLLPQLVRMLTGYESSFSRSGVHFMQNPLFPATALVVTWLAFDPFVQAVYCVLCFRAESKETGEDLLAALARVRRTGAMAEAVR